MSKFTRYNKINHYYHSGTKTSKHLVSSLNLHQIGPLFEPPIDYNKSRITTTIKTKTTIQQSKNHSTKRLSQLTTHKNNRKMDFKLAFFASTLLLLILCISPFLISGVKSLNCYHCSSVDDPGCDEAFAGKSNYTDTDCSKHLKADQTAKVCRKIVQYIEHKKVVIRSCGYIDEHEADKEKKSMCYKRSGTFAIMMESCNCYEDNCNHSASLVPNQSVLILLSLASCYYLTTCFISIKARSSSS